jgi:hypothetical protein
MLTHPHADDPTSRELERRLLPRLAGLLDVVAEFLADEPTPTSTFALERDLAARLREMGQAILEYAYNLAEPNVESCPARVRFGRETYRRRRKTPNTLGTVFGPIVIHRCVYECLELGERCIWPSEMRLGIVAGLATPALAERVGRWSADHEQSAVRALLLAEHGVAWSVTSLRAVVVAVRDGVVGPGQPARIERLGELLAEAEKSSGRHRPTLACGRDGVMVPIRNRGYQEAATATVSVHDRRGKRLGTVYLGRMPEPGQIGLTLQLTLMLTAVLTAWHARGRSCPRLQFLSDGGHHPQQFFRQVLSRMADPWRPGQCLPWRWTLDFFHACEHLGKVAEALFWDTPTAGTWYRRMRGWLRDRPGGVTQILRSASQHTHREAMTPNRREAFGKAYRYLRRYARWMDYAACRKARLPIGSGVTEAACKTVFAERLKRSGMTWGTAGGQVIVDLRVLVLSDVWERSYTAFVEAMPLPQPESSRLQDARTPGIAA